MTKPLTSQWPRQTTWHHLHSTRVGLKQHIQAPLGSTSGCPWNMKGAGRWCSGEVRSFWVGGPGWAGWNPGCQPPHLCFSHSKAGVRGGLDADGMDVTHGQTSTANTGALQADVSTAMQFCQNTTNYKLPRIEKRKLNINKQTKNTACQYEEEDHYEEP